MSLSKDRHPRASGGRGLRSLGSLFRGNDGVTPKRLLTTLVLTILVPTSAFAGAGVFSQSTVSLDQVPEGARAQGLGGAFTAIADDTTSVYWNPAGLSQSGVGSDMTFAMTYAALPYDRHVGFLAMSKQIQEKGTVAIGLLHGQIGSIPLTAPDGSAIGGTTDIEDTVYLNASSRPTGVLAVGVTVKAMYHGVSRYQAVGLGVDLGLHLQPWINRRYFIALAMQDLGSYLSWNTNTTDHATPILRLGQSYDVITDSLRAALDLEGRVGTPYFAARLGAEYQVYPQIWLRAGGDTFRRAISAGVSFLVREYSIDYAITRAFLDPEPLQHRVALTGRV